MTSASVLVWSIGVVTIFDRVSYSLPTLYKTEFGLLMFSSFQIPFHFDARPNDVVEIVHVPNTMRIIVCCTFTLIPSLIQEAQLSLRDRASVLSVEIW